MNPSWYQRWFGYTSEDQHITWGLIGEIVLFLAIIASAIGLLVLLIWWLA